MCVCVWGGKMCARVRVCVCVFSGSGQPKNVLRYAKYWDWASFSLQFYSDLDTMK